MFGGAFELFQEQQHAVLALRRVLLGGTSVSETQGGECVLTSTEKQGAQDISTCIQPHVQRTGYIHEPSH